MAIAVTTLKETLKAIFQKADKVYYFPDSSLALANQANGIELPVLEDGIGFDTGEANVSQVKLTDGTNWAGGVTAGDADISLQISSIHETINALLMEKKTTTSVSAEFDGMTYTGNGYSLAPKKVAGALLFVSKDKTSAVYLPNVEMYSSFNGEGGDDSTGYYNTKVVPLTDSNGAAFYPLTGTVTPTTSNPG